MNFLTPIAMKLLTRLLSFTLLGGTVSASVWAQSEQQLQAMKNAQREAKMQQQAERAQLREQRIQAQASAAPSPVSVQAPAQNRPEIRISPANGAQAPGGPRRLTPEERQQLRDQIRDARHMYQQGQ